MPEVPVNHNGNLILSALTSLEHERLASHLEYVEFPLGKILYEPEEPIRYAYFPLRGAVSIVTVLRGGGSVEAGVIGNEGIVGLPLALGTEMESNRRAQVQVAGSGMRMRAAAFKTGFKRGERLHDLALSYLHAFITQISQTAACNRMHRLEERLAAGVPGSTKLRRVGVDAGVHSADAGRQTRGRQRRGHHA
jgi:CRP-like cAMP-binding protein